MAVVPGLKNMTSLKYTVRTWFLYIFCKFCKGRCIIYGKSGGQISCSVGFGNVRPKF